MSCTRTSRRIALCIALCITLPLPAHAADFAAGSLIIPLDTGYQDSGMLQAFGLVYRLLSQGIPVQQVIAPGKAQGGVDFVANATDVQTAQTIKDHDYRGGPYVVGATHAAAALVVIAGWHGEGHVTTVHETTAPFSGSVARTLTAPPTIAVFANGNELTAFEYLNAAGIPDGTGQPWPNTTDTSRKYPGYPDVLDTAEIAGPTTTGAADGALFKVNGWPAYCFLVSMHYSIVLDNEVVREVRQWLNFGPDNQVYLQCISVTVFENSPNGFFLTTNGLVDDGGIPNPLRYWTPDAPAAQFDGPIAGDGGSLNSIGLASGSSFKPNVSVRIEEDRGQSSPNQIQIMHLTGYLDGNTSKGRVTVLAGHDYSTSLPVSTNPPTNAVRLFLNAALESGCTHSQVTAIGDRRSRPPVATLELSSAPEPFGAFTRVRYALPASGWTDAVVYDVGGRVVRRLASGNQTAGPHTLTWDGRLESGRQAPSGVYLVRVRTATISGTKRVTLLR